MPALVGGRYELLEVAGSGGEASVWRARDRQHDRIVALKVRRAGRTAERNALLREARVLLDLKPHAALPLVREDFFEGDAYYLVIDWVEGPNLAQLLAERGSPGLDVATALAHLRRVAEALEHLHAHSPPVVHQDVKPDNVIVRPDGDVALVDFGISGAEGMGTPAYRAPEVAGGAKPTPASDVYGLAATAYTLFVGTPPRPGPPPPLRGVPAAQADHLWRALERGLAYDPRRRPSSAAAFVSALEPVAARTNLPEPASSFVGREQDVAAVTDLIARSRLVTLVGAGGLGKTRLAFEAARRMAPAYGDGVWAAELAPVRDASVVARVVAAMFGVGEERGRSLLDVLGAELRDRRMLLVLDNCEHVLGAARELVAALVPACPGVDVLATSREALATSAPVEENAYEVRPLGVPAADSAATKALAVSDAVRLFLDRAGQRLDDESIPVVARICRQLDGMPLAIELAAARVGALDAEEVAARLDDRLSLRQTTGDERHSTLHTTFDWSYSLLDERERATFERLSVLPGGASADAAFAVTNGVIESRSELDAVLRALAAKSLVVFHPDENRYGFLQTVRAFALSKLDDSGAADATRDALLDWAIDVVTSAPLGSGGAAEAAGLAYLETEHDNLTEAVRYGLEAKSADVLRLVCALAGFWDIRGHWTEGRAALEAALQLDIADEALAASAFSALGRFAFLQADYDAARDSHGQALQLHSQTGDRSAAASSLADLGMVAEARGDFDSARDLYGQSLSAMREIGDAKGVAGQLTNLGNVAEYLADYETAQTLHEQSLEQRRALGDEQGEAVSMLNLGYVMNYRGDARGRGMLEEALARFRRFGDRYGASRALNLLAIRSWFEGDGGAARSLGEQALRLRYEIGDRLGIAVSLESLGGLGAFQGHGVYAGRLFGAARRLRESIGSPVTPSDQMLLDWASGDARKAVGEDEFSRALNDGQQMTLDDAVAFALSQPASA